MTQRWRRLINVQSSALADHCQFLAQRLGRNTLHIMGADYGRSLM